MQIQYTTPQGGYFCTTAHLVVDYLMLVLPGALRVNLSPVTGSVIVARWQVLLLLSVCLSVCPS